jgi:hypothetical protein
VNKGNVLHMLPSRLDANTIKLLSIKYCIVYDNKSSFFMKIFKAGKY